MFLCGVKDNDRNDDRFDSDELPAWLMLFSLLRTVFQGRKENSFEKEKKKKKRERKLSHTEFSICFGISRC